MRTAGFSAGGLFRWRTRKGVYEVWFHSLNSDKLSPLVNHLALEKSPNYWLIEQ